MRHDLGLDQPLPVQFWRYLEHLARGDLGISHITNQPVLSDLARTFPATIELASCAMIFGAVFWHYAGAAGGVEAGQRAG